MNELVTNKKVTVLEDAALLCMFNGDKYVWMKNADGSGALAYLDHVDDGDIKLEHVFSESFAHVFVDGTIRRFGAVIGCRDDLVFIAGNP